MTRIGPRHLAHAAGAALIGVGAVGLVADSAETVPVRWAVWLVGAAVLHDLLFVPAVLAVGALTAFVPLPYRRPVQAGLAVAGVIALIAFPLVRGFGRRGDNPSVLPQDYGANLLLVLAVIALGTGVAMLRARRAGGSPRGQDEGLDGQRGGGLGGERDTGGRPVEGGGQDDPGGVGQPDPLDLAPGHPGDGQRQRAEEPGADRQREDGGGAPGQGPSTGGTP